MIIPTILLLSFAVALSSYEHPIMAIITLIALLIKFYWTRSLLKDEVLAVLHANTEGLTPGEIASKVRIRRHGVYTQKWRSPLTFDVRLVLNELEDQLEVVQAPRKGQYGLSFVMHE